MYLDLLKQEQRFRLPFWRLNDREKGMTNAFCIAAAFSNKNRNKQQKQGIQKETRTKKDATVAFRCENAWRKVFPPLLDSVNA